MEKKVASLSSSSPEVDGEASCPEGGDSGGLSAGHQAPLDNWAVADESKAHRTDIGSPDLSTMSDRELFVYLSTTIRDEEMFRLPNLNRRMVMDRFSLSAVRIANAFSRGGGMNLPEFVRNCRLDYACRLMVEHPKMPLTKVGYRSGYQRTTTFYHDFKARFGKPPAEYREQKLRKAEEP